MAAKILPERFARIAFGQSPGHAGFTIRRFSRSSKSRRQINELGADAHDLDQVVETCLQPLRAAVRLASSAARVASLVTFGLPSRSPPIHDENRRNGRDGNGVLRVMPVEGRGELIVELRHGVEQDLAEEVQAPGNLLLEARPLQAKLAGHPQTGRSRCAARGSGGRARAVSSAGPPGRPACGRCAGGSPAP